MTSLITVLFHLVVLGVLALLSTIHFPGGDTLPDLIGRLGVLLLVLGVAHGVTIAVLARIHEEQLVETITRRGNSPASTTRAVAPAEWPGDEPRVEPVPGQEVAGPRSDYQGPYASGR